MLLYILIPLLKHLVANCQSTDNNKTPADQTSEYNKEALQKLTEYRQQHRRTIDGRLCAAAFVQDGDTFTDCTTTRDPNGTSGKEWCYVEVQLLGKDPNLKNWNYCQPVIDYDFLISQAEEALRLEIQETEHFITKINAESRRIDEVLDLYNDVCGPLSTMEKQFKELDDQQIELNRLLEISEKAQAAIDRLKHETKNLEADVRKAEAEALKDPENCGTAMESVIVHGLKGKYYDGPSFTSVPVETRVDKVIDFYWDGISPVSDVGHTAYSIEWSGYLEAPITGDYIFGTESTSGAMLFINDDLVILDRMPPPQADGDHHHHHSIPIIKTAGVGGRLSVTSPKPIRLEASEFYRVRLLTFHHSALRYHRPNLSVIKLMWTMPFHSPELTVIPSSRLYLSIPKEPLRMSGLDVQRFGVSKLTNGSQAFWDTDNYFIADVPLHLQDSDWLKYSLRLPEDQDSQERGSKSELLNVTVSFNQPATLYAAVSINGAFPIISAKDYALNFEETGDIISIYEAESRDTRARTAHHLRVFEADIHEAFSQIDLSAKDVLDPHHFVLVFARPIHSVEPRNVVCEDKSIVVSDPSNATIFESCVESDSSDEEHRCMAGFSSHPSDNPHHIWKTAPSGGMGSFLEITWTVPIRLKSMSIFVADDSKTWPGSLKVEFGVLSRHSSSRSRHFRMTRSNAILQVPFDLNDTVTRSMRITVEDVNDLDAATPIAMAITITGDPCRLQRDDRTASHGTPNVNVERSLITLNNCTETISDFPVVFNVFSNVLPPPQLGEIDHQSRPRFQCPLSCLQEAREAFLQNNAVPVFGGSPNSNKLYGAPSQLCAAALHSGICNTMSDCGFIVQLGPPMDEIGGRVHDGMKSHPISDGTPFSFSFLPLPTERKKIHFEPIVISFINSRDENHRSTSPHHFYDFGVLMSSQGEGIQYGWSTDDDRVTVPFCPDGYHNVDSAVAFRRIPAHEAVVSDLSVRPVDESERVIQPHRVLNDELKVVHEHIFGADDVPLSMWTTDNNGSNDHFVDKQAAGLWHIKVPPGKYSMEMILQHPCTADSSPTDETPLPSDVARHLMMVVNGELNLTGQTIMPGETVYSKIDVETGPDGLITISSPCPNREFATKGLCDLNHFRGDGEEGVSIETLRLSWID